VVEELVSSYLAAENVNWLANFEKWLVTSSKELSIIIIPEIPLKRNKNTYAHKSCPYIPSSIIYNSQN
jgi:hypothetical protein